MEKRPGQKSVNLALQGGGAHGAFTWGVLDRLLEDDRIHIEGVSATSAGAFNAAALKTGLRRGGRQGARELLDSFWGRVLHWRGPYENPWLLMLQMLDAPLPVMAKALALSPAYNLQSAVSRSFSPYQLNPFDFNILRNIIEKDIDFDAVCEDCSPKLFISATNVRSGKIKVFSGKEISADAILASACLPTMYRAVEIPDPETGRIEAYWDGGYMGNPALYPLFYETESRDVLVVHINPIERDEIPTTAAEIEDRLNEISFNSSLLRELRAVHFVGRLIDEGKIADGDMKKVLVHSIADDGIMRQLGLATKMVPNPRVMSELRKAGREAMDRFLAENFDHLDVRATTNLPELYS